MNLPKDLQNRGEDLRFSSVNDDGRGRVTDTAEGEEPGDQLTRELKEVIKRSEELRLQQDVEQNLHTILTTDCSEEEQLLLESRLIMKLKKDGGHEETLREKLQVERCKRYKPMAAELQRRSRTLTDRLHHGTCCVLDEEDFMEEQAHVFELESKLLRRLSPAKGSLEKDLRKEVEDERAERQEVLVRGLLDRSRNIREEIRYGTNAPQGLYQAGERQSEMEEQVLKKLDTDGKEGSLKQQLFDERNLRRQEYLRYDIGQHERCTTEGSPCPLTQALTRLDMDATPDVETTEGRKIICEATNLVDAIVKRLGDVETIFKEMIPTFEHSRLELRGSCTNGLKTGRVDELDFLVKLKELSFAENAGWKIVSDSEDLNCFLGTRDSKVVDLDTSWQLQYQGSQVPRHAQCFIQKSSWQHRNTGYGYLSGKILKEKFKEALDASVKDLIDKQPESSSSHVSFLYDDRTLSYFPADVSFSVKMDITPCVSVTRLDGSVQWLVPSLGFNNWQKVNVDPCELVHTSVSRGVRLFKTLRDAAEDKDTGYGRNVFCVMDEQPDGCRSYGDVSQFLTQHFATAVDRPLHSAIPSYAIMSTVVREFRRKGNQPLCCLLLTSFLNFEFINPEEKHLSRKHDSDSKATEVLSRCHEIVRYLCDAGADLAEAVQHTLPPYYHTHPFCLIKNLSSNTQISVLSYPKLKLLSDEEETDAGASEYAQVAGESGKGFGNHWVVHRMRKDLFVSLCHQQISLMKKKKQLLLKPFQAETGSDHVHVAVLALENKIFWATFSDYNTTTEESCMEDVLKRYVVRTGDQLTVVKASL